MASTWVASLPGGVKTPPAHSSSSACSTESPRIADNLYYVILSMKRAALQQNTFTVTVYR